MNDGVKKGVSRTNHVAKNILWAIINQAMMIALSLISRKIFLNEWVLQVVFFLFIY